MGQGPARIRRRSTLDPAARRARVIRDAVPLLPLPDPAVLCDAGLREASRARHDALAAAIPALHLIEACHPAAAAEPAPAHLRVAAWNLERCTAVETSAALLGRTGASVALLSEMDLGMARSGDRHTARDLAAALGAGHLYGVEFVELGLGFGRELEAFAGRTNAGALHGNALVSTLPFRDPFLIPLDDGGAWFDLDWHHRRIGGRMAVGAVVELAGGPVAMVSAHLENRSTPNERRIVVERLLAGLDAAAPGLPAVVAGDFNTASMPDPAAEPDLGWFERPEAREPLFTALRSAGFDWLRCNAPDQTRRLVPDGRRAPWGQRIDWFFTRGLAASAPMTWPAVGADGATLSDHELITVDLSLAAGAGGA